MEKEFRAWDSDNEKMLFTEEFQIYYEKDNGFHSGKTADNGEWGEMPIMQYVGLRCLDGNKIFEGDVFEVTDGDGWVVGKMLAKLDGETLSVDQRIVGHILGNIYETPTIEHV